MTHFIKSRGLEISELIFELLKMNTALNDTLSNYNTLLEINCFVNGRESGYMYTTYNATLDKFFRWVTYEHRNSDEIVINGKEGLNGLPYVGNKHEHIAIFQPTDISLATNKLATEIIEFIEKEN